MGDFYEGNPYEIPWLGEYRPGDKLVFLDKNGYDHDLVEARKLMKKGDVVTLRDMRVGDWSSLMYFEEFPDKGFNSVMFDKVLLWEVKNRKYLT
jgi:hypothetical protein